MILPFTDAKKENLVALVEGACNVHIYKEVSENKY